MAGDESSSAESDWGRWLTPTQSVRMLAAAWGGGLSFALAREEIFSRLKNGLLRAVAEDFVAKSYHRENERGKFSDVLQAAWANPSTHLSTQFWQAGNLQVGATGSPNEVAFFGIRFDPDQMSKLVDSQKSEDADLINEAAPNTASVRKQDLPLLHDSIARAWMSWYKLQPNSTKLGAEKSAANMFPNHNLSRDRIRDLFGDVTMGRPQKIND